jgi:hypothetical protein
VTPFELQRLPSDDRVLFGAFGDVLLCVGVAQETADTFRTWERNLRGLMRAHPAGVGAIFVVQHAHRPPPGHREGMVGLMRVAGDKLIGAAVVLEASGFAGAAQRSVASLIIGAAGLTRTIRVFSGSTDAVAWLAPRVAVGQSAGELLSAARTLELAGRATVSQHVSPA